jgi:DMSO reductase family type II enzyme heme b subunit
MEPGRSFHPPASSVAVQAVYDAESIALLVRWHDMSAEKTGKNGLSLPVQEGEEAQGAGAGVWGDAEAAPDQAAQSQTTAGGAQADESIWGEAEVAQTPGAAQQPEADVWGEAAAAPPAPASEFSDAVAIQIPVQAPVGARKPYFIFGDGQSPVDLWFFDLARPEPLQFTGRGSANIAPNDTGDVTGVASYDQGEWSVIFKRPLRASSGAALSAGNFMPIAFSVWDGFSRERGNSRGLTAWYSLYLGPEAVPSAVGPMIRTALVILAIELIVIGWVRWRHASGVQPAGSAGRFGRGVQPAGSGSGSGLGDQIAR